MEVFQVTGKSLWETIATSKEKQTHCKIPQATLINRFSEDINKVIITKQECLLHAGSEILHLDDSFKDEHKFITCLTSGHTKDVVVLNISSMMIDTK